MIQAEIRAVQVQSVYWIPERSVYLLLSFYIYEYIPLFQVPAVCICLIVSDFLAWAFGKSKSQVWGPSVCLAAMIFTLPPKSMQRNLHIVLLLQCHTASCPSHRLCHCDCLVPPAICLLPRFLHTLLPACSISKCTKRSRLA